MYKIIIAPDKFKGALSGLQFCDIVEEALKKHLDSVEIKKLPLADGGDGTVEVLEYYMGGERVEVEVHDPLARMIKASYLYSPKKRMAFIEMADASGIRLLKNEELNPLKTSTFGTGELIKHAIEKGAQHIILGIGGSATNDAGMGMARALGYRFYDLNHEELLGKGEDLNRLMHIDTTSVSPTLKDIKFHVACDVDNPLFGENGAAHIYAPQKGAHAPMVATLDGGLQNFSNIINNQFNFDLQNIAGAGAAGGLGAGTVLFLDAELKSGIALIKEIAHFDEQIKGADWMISGEGRLDEQTFSGKVIKGVMDSKTNQKLAVFCGFSELDEQDLAKYGVDYLAEVKAYAKNIDDSIKNSSNYLARVAEEFALKLKA
ncbi:glycerate kinase [Lentimicrobium sp. S6]|uniref:glycerate kinase n=1 Tax=Lentimicrobium sp. S6 TaxID=2735872 RepID=UPI001554D1DE|nr:glycerate kinase [Lentimicrobium sp. S6]NPD46263.1 glycerate kinase [Lentimicrobium sp. S6]